MSEQKSDYEVVAPTGGQPNLIVKTPRYVDPHEPIHHWFGLTYSSYLVIPRSILQSMPVEWQKRFVECLNEARESFKYLEMDDNYAVQLRSENGRFKVDPFAAYRHKRYEPKP